MERNGFWCKGMITICSGAHRKCLISYHSILVGWNCCWFIHGHNTACKRFLSFLRGGEGESCRAVWGELRIDNRLAAHQVWSLFGMLEPPCGSTNTSLALILVYLTRWIELGDNLSAATLHNMHTTFTSGGTSTFAAVRRLEKSCG